MTSPASIKEKELLLISALYDFQLLCYLSVVLVLSVNGAGRTKGCAIALEAAPMHSPRYVTLQARAMGKKERMSMP